MRDRSDLEVVSAHRRSNRFVPRRDRLRLELVREQSGPVRPCSRGVRTQPAGDWRRPWSERRFPTADSDEPAGARGPRGLVSLTLSHARHNLPADYRFPRQCTPLPLTRPTAPPARSRQPAARSARPRSGLPRPSPVRRRASQSGFTPSAACSVDFRCRRCSPSDSRSVARAHHAQTSRKRWHARCVRHPPTATRGRARGTSMPSSIITNCRR